MNKINKNICRIIIAILFTMTIFSSAITVSANEYESEMVQPRYSSINTLNCSITLNDEYHAVTGTATKKTSASSIEGTLILYKKSGNSWIYMDQAYKSVTRGVLGLEIYFDAESGATYKAVWTVTAYTNGVGETVVIEDIKTCP